MMLRPGLCLRATLLHTVGQLRCRLVHISAVTEARRGSRSRSSSLMRDYQDEQRTVDVIEEAQTLDVDVGPQHAPFPSDKRLDDRKHAFRPAVDPQETSILLFPGQGSQFVGMGAGLIKYPNVAKMYKMASEILGYNLLDLCTKGPEAKLNKTVHCQPAILVASLAAVEKLKEENPKAIERCVGAAGFSVGEFAALVFAGAMSFEDAVEVIKVRATAMQKASQAVDSGMMSVVLNADHKLNLAMMCAQKYCTGRIHIENPVCQVANYLYTTCRVLAGHSEALDFIEETQKDFGIRRVKRLPVSGAFHTNLMKSAKQPLQTALERIDLQPPIIYVHSNVTTRRHNAVDEMRKNLVEQVCRPVKWEQIMHMLYKRDKGLAFPQTFEVGPGRQLGTLLKMTNNLAFESYRNVSV